MWQMWNEFSTLPIFGLQICNAPQRILRNHFTLFCWQAATHSTKKETISSHKQVEIELKTNLRFPLCSMEICWAWGFSNCFFLFPDFIKKPQNTCRKKTAWFGSQVFLDLLQNQWIKNELYEKGLAHNSNIRNYILMVN